MDDAAPALAPPEDPALPRRARSAAARAHAWLEPARRALANPRAPLCALAAILAISLVARIIDISEPCTAPCRTPASHTLIFDEAYYVNAARVIDHINPPLPNNYHNARLGDDPNAEHPQLAKIMIALGIKIFGDNPDGWRLPSVLFGLIALAMMYAVVTGLGGSRWLAVGVTSVAALDNLFLVHGRIATLDIFALAMVLVSASLYVRRRPWLAAVALGLGGCMKETALYAILVFVGYEFLRWLRVWWKEGDTRGWVQETLRPAFIVSVAGVIVFVLGLWIMDLIVPAYDTGTSITYAGSPFTHLFHIIHYADSSQLKAITDATGISSTPFQWLLNLVQIDYARVAVNSCSGSGPCAGANIIASRPTIYFQGAINPFIIFFAIPAFFAAVAQWWHDNDRVALFGFVWVLGTYLPSVFDATVAGRIAYLYYMLLVMPGVYIIVTKLFARRGMPAAATFGWAVALVYSFLNLYPIRTLF